MTPAQLDHLRAIDAHLDALLALAAKRTPGRWLPGSDTVWAKDEEDERVCNDCGGWDPDYIAACAGRTEAGWRSTKAAIDTILAMQTAIDHAEKQGTKGFVTESLEVAIESLMPRILAAWPRELLTLP